MMDINGFKGFKKVKKSTFLTLTDIEKKDFIWFVYDSNINNGELYFGNKKYGTSASGGEAKFYSTIEERNADTSINNGTIAVIQTDSSKLPLISILTIGNKWVDFQEKTKFYNTIAERDTDLPNIKEGDIICVSPSGSTQDTIEKNISEVPLGIIYKSYNLGIDNTFIPNYKNYTWQIDTTNGTYLYLIMSYLSDTPLYPSTMDPLKTKGGAFLVIYLVGNDGSYKTATDVNTSEIVICKTSATILEDGKLNITNNDILYSSNNFSSAIIKFIDSQEITLNNVNKGWNSNKDLFNYVYPYDYNITPPLSIGDITDFDSYNLKVKFNKPKIFNSGDTFNKLSFNTIIPNETMLNSGELNDSLLFYAENASKTKVFGVQISLFDSKGNHITKDSPSGEGRHCVLFALYNNESIPNLDVIYSEYDFPKLEGYFTTPVPQGTNFKTMDFDEDLTFKFSADAHFTQKNPHTDFLFKDSDGGTSMVSLLDNKRKLIDLKSESIEITQTLGQSAKAVISQKAITDNFEIPTFTLTNPTSLTTGSTQEEIFNVFGGEVNFNKALNWAANNQGKPFKIHSSIDGNTFTYSGINLFTTNEYFQLVTNFFGWYGLPLVLTLFFRKKPDTYSWSVFHTEFHHIALEPDYKYNSTEKGSSYSVNAVNQGLETKADKINYASDIELVTEENWKDTNGVLRAVYIKTFTGTTPTLPIILEQGLFFKPNDNTILNEIVYTNGSIGGYTIHSNNKDANWGIGLSEKGFWVTCETGHTPLSLVNKPYSITIKYTKK